jgi:predicted amidohydrolase YtcJ
MPGLDVVDLDGKRLIPGLIDGHAHDIGRSADVHSEAASRARAMDGPSESHRFRHMSNRRA